MKKLTFIAIIVATLGFAAQTQTLVGQFYTIRMVNRGTLQPDRVGYLEKKFNYVCDAKKGTGIGVQACGIFKATPTTALSMKYYRIIKANHGTLGRDFFVGWMENDDVCGATGGTGMGAQGCAVIRAELYTK